MSDDGLFSLNAPAGRKCFICNALLLSAVSFILYFCLNTFLKPNLINAEFVPIVNLTEVIVYIFLLFIGFSLFERRIYDIVGNRRSYLYNISVLTVFLDFLLHSFIILVQSNFFSSVPFGIANLIQLCNVFDMILLIISVMILLIPGKFNH